jgi:FkbM family methyltransferase
MITSAHSLFDQFRAELRNHLADLLVVDVGAHGADSGDVYSPALSENDLVIGFEPNANECTRLNLLSKRRRYFPYAIGDGRPGEFRICAYPLTSSLFEPNIPLLRHYENLAELCSVVGREPIDTRRLDDIDELCGGVDFLKLDVQGGTLAALSGAERMLDRTLIVHCETEFAPIYQGEPLFSECERFLRDRGFMFHHFHRIEGRRVLADGSAVGLAPTQALWADSVFIPSLERLPSLSAHQLIRFAWLMHTVYSAADFAMLGFSLAAKAGGPDYSQPFRRLLQATNALSPDGGGQV